MDQASNPTTRDLNTIADTPALLVGAPRSGTTWLQRMLLDHPACCGRHESHLLNSISPLVEDFHNRGNSPQPHGVAAYLTQDELRGCLRDLWRRTFRSIILNSPEASVLIEKTPDHAVHLDLADELMPGCRVIHVARDSRAVVASLLRVSRTEWGKGWAPDSINAAAMRWLECVNTAESNGRKLGEERFLRIHNENIRTAPANELQRVFAFLEIENGEALCQRIAMDNSIESYKAGRGPTIPFSGELIKNTFNYPPDFIDEGPVDNWRNELTAEQADQVWTLTADTMQKMGYDENGLRAEYVDCNKGS